MNRLTVRIAVVHAALLVAFVALMEATGALSGETLGFLVAALAAAAAASAALTIVALRPLRGLVRAARAMAEGRIGQQRAGPEPVRELRELTEVFNQMAQSLEEKTTTASQELNRLRDALNSSADAVVAVDPRGGVAFANAAAERLCERSQEEIIGKPFVWLMPHEEIAEALRATREDGARVAFIIERPKGRYLEVIATPIASGGEWTALVVFHDVTDVKRVEQIRRDFAANVSHELRTPLASIKSVIETLQAGALEDTDTARDFLSRMDSEVDRLVKLVEELLELSRIESGQVPLAREPVEVGTVLRNAFDRLRPQAEKLGLSLTLEVAPEIPPITGDADRLERAAMNLIQNAFKFTPAGGSVSISARVDGDAVTVTVADTGQGIAPEDLPRVFERFFKADRARDSEGTGLGLAVVKHTVEAHGGQVSVESALGQGAAFTFSIPVK